MDAPCCDSKTCSAPAIARSRICRRRISRASTPAAARSARFQSALPTSRARGVAQSRAARSRRAEMTCWPSFESHSHRHLGLKLLAIAAPMALSSAKIASASRVKATRRPRARPSMKSGRSSRFRRVIGLAAGWTPKLCANGCDADIGRGAGDDAAGAAQNGLASGAAIAAGTVNGLGSCAAAGANRGPSGGGTPRAGRAAGGKGGGPAGGRGAPALRSGGGPAGRARTDETESSAGRAALDRTGVGVADWREGRLIPSPK
jgi:hypothetical protein